MHPQLRGTSKLSRRTSLQMNDAQAIPSLPPDMVLEERNFISEPFLYTYRITSTAEFRATFATDFGRCWDTYEARSLTQNDWYFQISPSKVLYCYATPAVQRRGQGVHYDAVHGDGPGPRYRTPSDDIMR